MIMEGHNQSIGIMLLRLELKTIVLSFFLDFHLTFFGLESFCPLTCLETDSMSALTCLGCDSICSLICSLTWS